MHNGQCFSSVVNTICALNRNGHRGQTPTGNIADFNKIKRKLQSHLSDELFLFPAGNTDSEWAFALFLQQLSKVCHPKRRSVVS
jgi:hypothetical protein